MHSVNKFSIKCSSLYVYPWNSVPALVDDNVLNGVTHETLLKEFCKFNECHLLLRGFSLPDVFVFWSIYKCKCS